MENLAGDVAIGAQYGSGSYGVFWHDKIDNVMIFNKELSLAEISTFYTSGTGSSTSVIISATSNDTVPVGWHYIAATYSAPYTYEANGILFYVDGVAVGATYVNDVCYVSMKNTDANVILGAQMSSTSVLQYVFADKIDDMAVFSDVLTPAEVATFSSDVPYEITTSYDVNDLRQVKFIQKNDVMYLCHPDYPVQKLSRYEHTLWTIDDVNWIWGPFLDENINDDVNITPSGTTGNITLTASDDLFTPEHVGSLWKITEKQTTTYLKQTISTNAPTSSIKIQGDYLLKLVSTGCDAIVILEKSEDDGTTWIPVYQRPGIDTTTDFDVEYSGNEAEAGWEYRVTTESGTGTIAIKMTLTAYNTYIDGYVKITGYTSPTVVLAEVISELAGTTATNRWCEGAWSKKRGYSRAIDIYQNRLCFAGTTYLPNTFWASQSGDFENMQVSSLDNGAIVYEVGSARQNPILWLQDKQGILAGTSDSLIRIFSQSNDSVLTSKSTGSERQSQVGSGDLQAQLLNDSLIFVNRNYRKVFDSVYDLQSESFVSPELTVYAEHITDPCVIEVAVQNGPDPILWFIVGDGNCVTLTYNASQLIVAWARHITDGNFKSVAVIPGNTEDEVWFVVERNINDSNVGYVEKLHKQDWGADPNNCWFVDSGLEYNGTETNTITGLGHLEGKSVQIFYDGNSIQEANVSSGVIALDPNVTRALVGLPYTSTLITFPVELPTQGGSTVGYKKKIYEVRGCFYKSMYGKCGYLGPFKPAVMYNIPFSSCPDSVIGTDAPFTGQIKLPIDSGNDDEVRLKLIQSEPYPFNLTGLVIKVDVSQN